jgi:MFS transporter, ACS family, D-galactonate transporter
MNSSRYYKWILVALLWVVALLNYLDRQMLSTMRPSMQVDILELQSATNFGYLMAIFLWIYGLTSPLAGVVADWFNKKYLIIGSLFIWSLVTYAMSWATSYDQLFVLRALMGVSEALYVPASLALIVEFHTSTTRSLAVGIHITGFYIGQALGGFGATIAEQISWQSTFGFFGAFGMLYSIFLIFTLKSPPNQEPVQENKNTFSILKGIPILLVNTSFWIILFYFAMPGIPGWAVKNWLPTLFSENLHIDMTKAGPLATITIALSSLIGVIFGGILSDKWIQKNIKARIYIGAIGISLTIPALLLIGFGDSLTQSLIAAICFGFGFGMFDSNNMPIVCQFVSSKYRATAYGLMNMVGVLTGAFATGVLGKYSDENNLGNAFAMLSVLVILALVVQLIFLKPTSDNFEESK